MIGIIFAGSIFIAGISAGSDAPEPAAETGTDQKVEVSEKDYRRSHR
ncbi:MAG: hypothetical protein U5N58_02475 [Actinomycetota bacterium]|nr:hypothetical protein [Actinomycetota bacterium]